MNEERVLGADKTCKNCVKNEVCKYCDAMEKLVKDLPLHAEPEGRNIFFIVLANNCPLYQKRKFLKT